MSDFRDDFAGSKLSEDWCPHAEVSLAEGILSFAPATGSTPYLITKSCEFTNYSMSADVRVVSGAVGFVARWQSPSEYYLAQFDINDEDDQRAWFHAFSPTHKNEDRMLREIVPSTTIPRLGEWVRMGVRVEGFTLTLALGQVGDSLKECASWTDHHRLFRSGAVGFWESPGGERAEFRNLEVEPLNNKRDNV